MLVIQECEDPERANDGEYLDWVATYKWCGENKNKGIGIFVRRGLYIDLASIDVDDLKLFLPCYLNGSPFLGVWTQRANSPTFGYIGQLWKFLQKNEEFLRNSKAIIAGDLNSNARWDLWDRWWNHSDVVNQLHRVGLRSVYHDRFNCKKGEEEHFTFYMHRRRSRPYHIDYIFASSFWEVDEVRVEDFEVWSQLSDHVPLITSLSGR